MRPELERLGLDPATWQALAKEKVPVAADVQCSYPNRESIRFRLFDAKGNLIARFRLTFLPSCRGILVSHNVLVSPEYRRRGIAKSLLAVKLKVAQDLGVPTLLSTVRDDNVAELAVIREWERVYLFRNPRTSNTVGVHIGKVGLP
jgi:GNAT superfamily N-acetyltransferase